ncbi:ABC-type transport system permease component [Ehrlichia ruminantium]|uniref:ABC-type transport system permease component n=1 Tax=Ehrlichia ruminantium TaxID=779 RepID=A0A170S9T3_EHRRU|nr:ABC-type transport system permease component [Ehrlichia ruminantium]GAT77782.1 ABC-type transport system permease component [Ehrlichia ruminantium]
MKITDTFIFFNIYGSSEYKRVYTLINKFYTSYFAVNLVYLSYKKNLIQWVTTFYKINFKYYSF